MPAGTGTVRVGPGDVLITVDVQRDFLPGGSLGVPGGDEVVPVLNRCIEIFTGRGLPVIATRDWHPPGHCSFKAQGGPWPPHCLAGSAGAGWADDLRLPPSAVVISKATGADRDAYSGFQGTGLEDRLRRVDARRLFVGGLATDYCVLNTVLDGRAAGFEVWLLEDAVRAVNLEPGDGDRALERMREAGARLIPSAKLA